MSNGKKAKGNRKNGNKSVTKTFYPPFSPVDRIYYIAYKIYTDC